MSSRSEVISRIFHRERHVLVYATNPRLSQPTPLAEQEVCAVDRGLVSLIARDRPGYQGVANSYLDQGHNGFALVRRGHVVGLGWVFRNDTDRNRRAKGYFVTPPGTAYFHADWTHPKHRRTGVHASLLAARIASHRGLLLLSNISINNSASLESYQRAGFTLGPNFLLLSILGRTYATPHTTRLSPRDST